MAVDGLLDCVVFMFCLRTVRKSRRFPLGNGEKKGKKGDVSLFIAPVEMFRGVDAPMFCFFRKACGCFDLILYFFLET